MLCLGGFTQVTVKTRKGQSFAQGQIEIGRVVNRQLVLICQMDQSIVRNRIG
jgi:hypothetical protein